MKKEFLNEESYNKTRKGFKLAGILVILFGLLLGGLITFSAIKSENAYQTDKKEKLEILTKEIADLKEQKYDESSNKTMLEKSRIREELTDKESEKFKLENDFDHTDIIFKITPAIMINMLTISIGAILLMKAYERNMIAYQTQTVMPVAQEGMEKMAPTVGKVGGDIAREMAPVYGEIAKEISKGIQEGKNEANNK